MPTLYQRLTHLFSSGDSQPLRHTEIPVAPAGDEVVFQTNDPQEYKQKVLQTRQTAMLARQWRRAQYDLNNTEIQGLSQVKLMYRECDMMDLFPEIGTALDIMMEEVCTVGDNGQIINITSNSERVKSTLQDLFYNRLSINATLPMVTRATCKYGNDYMLLNISEGNGVEGWKQLPVYDMERYEHGMSNPYIAGFAGPGMGTETDTSPKFVWVGGQNYTPYRNWQMAHFRLLYDSIFLPYGVSVLHKARRHFRMLSMMEDMMLIYRLERSVERRVFKINVGAIDEADVPAYIQDIANQFKRTQIIDPQTGQIDLRKNILPVWRKTPIPLRDGRTITIEELAKEFENGKTNEVYSVLEDGDMTSVVGQVRWCGKSYTADKMVKVVMNDGTYIVLAPEHEVILSNGDRKEAECLVKGDEIATFNCNAVEVDRIEWIDGDDVYCMSVFGPDGEDDRHNFAVLSFKDDDEPCNSGCYVANCQTDDFFIPVREDNVSSPIETLPSAQNLTAMDDIKYVQNKVLTALKVPKQFLNFEEASGQGNNLSLLDVRFSRTIRRIQQALIMELNKIAIIHLYLLGFEDELTNFSITMNNPSSQAEMLQLENTAKKITAAKDAVTDPGGGIPLMSMHKAWSTILKWSDKEIQENLDQMRLEAALAKELEQTNAIINRTGIFDEVDNIYGIPNAQYPTNQEGEGGDDGDMGGGSGGGGMALGDMDFGNEVGEEGDMDMGDAAEGGLDGDMPDLGGGPDDAGGDLGGDEGAPEPTLGESIANRMLDEIDEQLRDIKPQAAMSLDEKQKRYRQILQERTSKFKEQQKEFVPQNGVAIYDKAFVINEEMNSMSKEIKDVLSQQQAADNVYISLLRNNGII